MSSEEISVISDHVLEIYTWISLVLICQFINIFGIVTNVINIICFVKQGFEESVNVSLLGLAVSDLGSLTTMVWSCICFIPTFATIDMPFEPIEICYLTSAMLHFAFTRVSACITAMITVERCLCITAPLKVKNIITSKRSTVITVCLFIILGFSGCPVYFVNSWGMKFSTSRNKTIYGLVSTEHREQVEMFTFTINNFIIPFSAFVIIFVCAIIISIKLRRSSKWRLEAVSCVDRVSSRNQKTAKMVVMISSLFIICFVPVCVIILVVGLVPSLSVSGKNVRISYLIAGFTYIMEGINSSINTFIYYRMSSKYRDSLRKIAFIVKLIVDSS